MKREIAVAMNPMRSETRAPYTTRLKTSRPMSSVPNQWSADGPCRKEDVRSVML